MSDTTLGLQQAARRLGVSIRVLRGAIRAGALPPPPQLGATCALPTAWVEDAAAKADATPAIFRRPRGTRVPDFARYEGTSAFRIDRRRARAYAAFRAAR